MAKEYIITDEVSKALDSIDWNALGEHFITRADVEANPQAACELASGRATSVLVSYSIPGIPEKREAQLISRRFIDHENGGYVLDPKVVVKTIDRNYELSEDNIVIAGLFDENGRSYRLDPSKAEEKAIIDAILPKTEKGRDSVERSYNCSICPSPLTITYKSGRQTKSYIGWDSTSNRPVYRNADNLRALLLTEDGHSRIDRPLFGKGIVVDYAMAAALANGQIVAAFGESNGKQFATALSFNIARGQITEDHSKQAEVVRKAAYEYLRNRQGQSQEKTETRKQTRTVKQEQPKTEQAATTRKRGAKQTI